MNEANISRCKKCLQDKQRIQSEKFPDGKNKRWVDEAGALWNGRVCPNCQRELSKNHIKKVRSSSNGEEIKSS